jgi:hypothetical protein
VTPSLVEVASSIPRYVMGTLARPRRLGPGERRSPYCLVVHTVTLFTAVLIEVANVT